MITSYAKSIARLAKRAAQILRRRGELRPCHKMCKECAFKWEQPHTLQYFVAAETAASQLMSEGKFNCHTSDYRDAGRPCAGYMMIRQAFDGETFEEGETLR